ncbi:hypothetical protein DF040_33785 [Burkholderia cenocepacia]|nr:hypothetical protein DF040_33785 [Burkholderia cenocepacia]
MNRAALLAGLRVPDRFHVDGLRISWCRCSYRSRRSCRGCGQRGRKRRRRIQIELPELARSRLASLIGLRLMLGEDSTHLHGRVIAPTDDTGKQQRENSRADDFAAHAASARAVAIIDRRQAFAADAVFIDIDIVAHGFSCQPVHHLNWR